VRARHPMRDTVRYIWRTAAGWLAAPVVAVALWLGVEWFVSAAPLTALMLAVVALLVLIAAVALLVYVVRDACP